MIYVLLCWKHVASLVHIVRAPLPSRQRSATRASQAAGEVRIGATVLKELSGFCKKTGIRDSRVKAVHRHPRTTSEVAHGQK